MLTSAVILHHPQSEGAAALAARTAADLRSHGVRVSVAAAWDTAAESDIPTTELVVCIGGDGTVLRAASLAVPHRVPLLGVNMGRLGFLTDISPEELFDCVDRLVQRSWRIEERILVRGDLDDPADSGVGSYHGLNDIVISRRAPGRPIYIALGIDGARVATYRCDGMIISTPTGSTGYSLSAGGPILAPTEHHLVVTPVSAHLALGRSLVLQPHSSVELRVTSDHGAFLSVDGQRDLPMTSGAVVRAGVSEHRALFVRFREQGSFYSELAEKLEFQMSSAMSPPAGA